MFSKIKQKVMNWYMKRKMNQAIEELEDHGAESMAEQFKNQMEEIDKKDEK